MVSLPPLPLIPLLLSLISALVISLSSALIHTLRSLLFIHSATVGGWTEQEKDDTRWREPAGGVWGRVSCFFYAIFLLNCSVGGQGHHSGVNGDSVKSKEDGKRRRESDQAEGEMRS